MKKIVLAITLLGAAGFAAAETIQNTAEGPNRAETCALAISRAKLLATNINGSVPVDFGRAQCECDKTNNGYFSCIAFVEVFKE